MLSIIVLKTIICGGGSNDSFSSKLCVFTVVGILVISRSLFADSGVLTGGGGTRKAGLPRGIETVYVRDYEVTK
jgi:hypothetical protein